MTILKSQGKEKNSWVRVFWPHDDDKPKPSFDPIDHHSNLFFWPSGPIDHHSDSFAWPSDTMDYDSDPFVPYFVNESNFPESNEDDDWMESN